MKVLITGAGGFIGSHLVRRVAQDGHAVVGVMRPGESRERLSDCADSVSLLECDLSNGDAVRKLIGETRPEIALHLAWYVETGKYWQAGENLECVRMSLGLAQALAEAGCSRFVGAGTCAEYDWNYGFLTENITPLKPRSLYGICKNATREILHSYCDHAGMSFAWTRFFLLYGPMEPKERLIPYVVLAMLKAEKAKCSEGTQLRIFSLLRTRHLRCGPSLKASLQALSMSARDKRSWFGTSSISRPNISDAKDWSSSVPSPGIHWTLPCS